MTERNEMTAHAGSSHHKPSPLAIVVLPLLVAFVVTMFAWPTSRQEPRDLPIGVAGPQAATQALEKQLSAHEGAFEVRSYPDEAAAREAIEDREIYGSFVATPEGSRVLTASAASPSVAQMLTRAASEGATPAQAASVKVEDVVPASSATAGLGSSVLPLVLAGILTGLMASMLASGALGRAGLVLAGAVLGGLTANVLIQSWLGVVEGDWLTNAGVLSLTILAIGSFVAGMKALLGNPGAILAAVTMVFIGNPFSGVASGPEMLPQPVGAIGQLMPPGAGGNLLRSTGFFDGAAAGGHVAVLVTWALVGMAALLAAGLVRSRRTAAAPVPVPA
jgi:hypothetical protein